MSATMECEVQTSIPGKPPKIRFDRNEWAGAFGDLGTDFPLLVGMILIAGLDAASALILFGTMQVLTGLRYRMPMPVQPLKAMAALVITQEIGGGVLLGGGLAIGIIMLLLALSGGIDWLVRVAPKTVVRGIQLGLGLHLASIALGKYVPAEGIAGWALAGAAFVLTVFLIGNRRWPAALFVIALGLVYAVARGMDWRALAAGAGPAFPRVHVPSWNDVTTGLIVLALPQLPLSLTNSVLATRQVAEDFFPERPLRPRTIGLTYALMNLVNPFFGGVPTCHGSGGMAGHYAFGGRTGGSVVIYGGMYLTLGLLFSGCFAHVIAIFPKPILGVLLLFEGLAMMLLAKDVAVGPRGGFAITLLVGLCCFTLPYGYLVGLGIGMALSWLAGRGWTRIGM